MPLVYNSHIICQVNQLWNMQTSTTKGQTLTWTFKNTLQLLKSNLSCYLWTLLWLLILVCSFLRWISHWVYAESMPLIYYQHHHLSLCSNYLQRKKKHWFSKQHNLLATVTPGSSSYRNLISWWCLIWYYWLMSNHFWCLTTWHFHCYGVGRNTSTVLRMQPFHLDLSFFSHYCVRQRTS